MFNPPDSFCISVASILVCCLSSISWQND